MIAVDPTRRRGGGALLGDRIRMNSLDGGPVFFRSMATRDADGTLPAHLADVIATCQAAGFDLVVVETPGIGQGDAAIVPYVDVSLYVMTPEYGAASQLEKIDMLDFADAVAMNKFERRGAEDARRDVARQLVRNRGAFGVPWDEMPVFGTSAARFDDDGVTALYQYLRGLLADRGLAGTAGRARGGARPGVDRAGRRWCRRPGCAYLAEVAETVRGYHARTVELADLARRRQALSTAARRARGRRRRPRTPAPLDDIADSVDADLERSDRPVDDLSGVRSQLAHWPLVREQYAAGELVFHVRGREVRDPAAPYDPVGHVGAAGRAAADERPRRAGAVPARGEPAGPVPVHRGRVPVQAGRRGAGPHVRRRGRPGPHEPALPPAGRRCSRRRGCRRRSTR